MPSIEEQNPPTVSELSVVRFEEPNGNYGRPRSNRNWKEDKKRASYDLPDSLLERFASFIQDEEYLSLAREIALLRTMLNTMLLTVQNWEKAVTVALEAGADLKDVPKPPISLTSLLSAIDNVGKMVEREHRMVYGDVNTITVESAVTFALAVADIVNTYVKDPKAVEAVHKAIRDLLTRGTGFKINLEVTKRLLDPTYSQASPSSGAEEAQDAT